MRARGLWAWLLMGALAGAGCGGGPTDETPVEEREFKQALAAMGVGVADVSKEGGDRFLNPLSFLTAELRDNWVYHLSFELTLKTGDKGTLTLDAQFTDNGRAIPLPTSLSDNPILNLDATFVGTFKGEAVNLTADMVLRNPSNKVVALTGGGVLNFSDLRAAFNTTDFTIDFNLTPIPIGSIALDIAQPDFGNWTGSATFQGTPMIHVLATNGVRTFDLNINLLTGEIT